MNRQIRRLALALIVLYTALFVQLNVLQIGRQEELQADSRNTRATVRDSVSKITTVLVPNVCANTGTWSTITVPATARRGHKVGIALLSHKALAAPTSIDVGWDEVTCR